METVTAGYGLLLLSFAYFSLAFYALVLSKVLPPLHPVPDRPSY